MGPFEWTCCLTENAMARLSAGGVDLVLVGTPWAGWTEGADGAATVLLRDDGTPAERIAWLRAGVQDVLAPMELASTGGAWRLRSAVERHRLRQSTRQAFATDVHTGLPHEGQLLEHMSHLLALREREPAPMALLVLRLEGFATTSARLGPEAAGALRRKVAVRVRAGVRSSDVVASLGNDSFAVLLSSIEAPADATRVASKLQSALLQPFKLAGVDVALAAAIGLAESLADGSQPLTLLRRAAGRAAAAQAVGRSGFANRAEREQASATAPAPASDNAFNAANDD